MYWLQTSMSIIFYMICCANKSRSTLQAPGQIKTNTTANYSISKEILWGRSLSVAGIIFYFSKDKYLSTWLRALQFNPSKWDRSSVRRPIHHWDMLTCTSWSVRLLFPPTEALNSLIMLFFHVRYIPWWLLGHDFWFTRTRPWNK